MTMSQLCRRTSKQSPSFSPRWSYKLPGLSAGNAGFDPESAHVARLRTNTLTPVAAMVTGRVPVEVTCLMTPPNSTLAAQPADC